MKASPARRSLAIVGLGALVLSAGFAIGVALGLLSDLVWVWGMFALGVGVGLGIVSTFGDALFCGRPTLAGAALATLAVCAAWVVWQGFEDANQRRDFAVDLARSRAADTGLSPDEMARAFDEDPEASIAFLAKDADAILAEQVRATTGMSSWPGRFVARHSAGLRLASAGRKMFGLPVGAVVSSAGTLAELALALWLLSRVRRAAVRRQEANTV